MDATRHDSSISGIGLAEFPIQPLTGVAGLIFELPGVLYEATVWRRWLLRLLARLGLSVQYDAFYEVWESDYLADVHTGQRTLNEALAEYLLSLGLPAGLVEEVISAAAAQRKVLDADPRLFRGVAATLARLSEQGFALAVSSDSDHAGDELREMLGRLGVVRQFRHVVSSRDLRTTKPEPVCYLSAVTALGTTPESTVFIGYQPGHLAGAKSVGLRTIAIGGAPHAAADCYVARFDRLPSWLRYAGSVRQAG